MNCNNCGARVKDGAKLCPVCGAMLEDESNYTLLATDERYDDFYTTEEEVKKHSPWRTVLVLLLVMLLAGGGAYYYFNHIKPQEKAAPSITFTEGSGVINRDQKVIYLTLDNPSIEFIHGVSLYEGDITAAETDEEKPEPLELEYEYTKNIDATFRAIFFDTAPLELKEDQEYTYTYEMFFSFVGSDEMYRYTKAVTFSGKIEGDASDAVFDHTMTEGVTEATSSGEASSEQVTQETTEEKTTKEQDASFIYDGYWYTAPQTEGENRSISAFKFNQDKTYKVTHYDKKGTADWVIYSEDGKYALNGDTIVLDDGSQFIIDSSEEAIFEESNGEKTNAFTKRKYNSRQNSEDFFGI